MSVAPAVRVPYAQRTGSGAWGRVDLPTPVVAGTFRVMHGRLVGVIAVLLFALACAGSPGGGPRTSVYASCREALFHSELGLEPQARDSVVWPRLNSRSVIFDGGGKHYSVTIRHVTVDAGRQHSNAVVDCTARQTANGRWVATAEVQS
jgi:hypothetical protein